MTDNVRGKVLDLIKHNWYKVALILIIIIALWYRLGIINSFVIPTYGNTMYHVGIERETIVTGYYPTLELSYGGGFHNFYVPAYRMLIASMSVATGIDPMVMSGLMTITVAIFILLALYALALRLSNNLYIALFAAFFFLMSPDLTIYTMRPLPELLGLLLVPFTIYFVIQKNWPVAVLGAIATALTHQMTLLTLFAVISLYTAFQLIRAGYIYYKRKDRKEDYMPIVKQAMWCVVVAGVACLTYALWQMYSMGTLNILNIAQVVNREGNPVDLPLFARTGVFVLPFCAIGLVYIISEWLKTLREPKAETATGQASSTNPGKSEYAFHITTDSVLLIIAWVIMTLLLTFNDWFGIHIFMDRFLTFFAQIAVVVAGFGMYALLSAFGLDILKEKPE